MSKHSHIKSVPSIENITIERQEYYDRFTGTQANLVAAGLATDTMFPVWPKRIKDHIDINESPVETRWRIRRIKDHRFELVIEHEYRQLEKEYTTADYKKLVLQSTTVYESIIQDLIHGRLSDREGFSLTDSQELSTRLTQLVNDIRNAGIVVKPKLVLIKEVK